MCVGGGGERGLGGVICFNQNCKWYNLVALCSNFFQRKYIYYWFYVFIHKKAKIGKITGIKKCELHNTTVYLVNYIVLPGVVDIHSI